MVFSFVQKIVFNSPSSVFWESLIKNFFFENARKTCNEQTYSTAWKLFRLISFLGGKGAGWSLPTSRSLNPWTPWFDFPLPTIDSKVMHARYSSQKKRGGGVAKANASSIEYHISLKSTHVFITQNPSNGAHPKLHNF